MRFAILGPVGVWHRGVSVPVGGGRERFVLAILLLNANQLVRADALIDMVWRDPPPSAKAQLHNLVSKLRRGLPSGRDGLICSHPGGYELRLGSHELDLDRFRALVEQARQAAARGDHASATSAFDEALAQWRGPALADAPDDLAAEPRRSLHEERLAVAESAVDSLLALGRHENALREIDGMLAEHPYREGLHEKRMFALVQAGRRAEALDYYRAVYRRFADDLGLEPGRPLRELEQQVLRGEAIALSPPLTPRQLPPHCPTLTGRDDLIADLGRALRARQVTLLVGPGGVGKSALAVAVAHELAEEFPDGQLYADLRGPQDPHSVLGRFVRALGVAGSTVPDDPDERVAMYRSQLAGKRVLVLLDDASTEEQVRPLLPGESGCHAVITSRHQLGALVDAARWTIPVLTPADGVGLLGRIAGGERIATEPDAAAEIVELCACLPLAVCVAAGRLAVNPHWTLGGFRARLSEQRRRLDELWVGDLDVRASLALSYDALDPDARRLFLRLDLVEPSTWPAWVVDVLHDAPAAHLLEALIDVHLVEPVGPDAVGQNRFRLHQLVAAFVTERASAEDDAGDRDAATHRLLSSWLALATAADELIPHDVVRAPALDLPPAPSIAVRLARQAPLDWFEAERRNLLLAVEQACRLGSPELAARLAVRLSGFLSLRSYGDDWDSALRQAIGCAREHESEHLLIGLLAALFVAYLRADRYVELPAIAAEELAVARAFGDDAALILALRHAGTAADRVSSFIESTEWYEQAVTVARQSNVDKTLLTHSIAGLANALVQTGALDRALSLLEEAIEIDATTSPSMYTATHLYSYGIALTRRGQLTEAERALIEAARVNDEMDHALGAAYIDQALADVDIRGGRLTQATQRLKRARKTHEEIGARDGLAEALRSTGDLAAAQGRWTDAIDWTRRALVIWRRIQSPVETARTLARLERAYRAAGDLAAAAACCREYQVILADRHLSAAWHYLPPLPSTSD